MFDEMWCPAHDDADVVAEYVKIVTASGMSLHLSHGHYLPVKHASQSEVQNDRADTVAVHDSVYVVKGDVQELETVVSVDVVEKQGVFHPMTLEGMIVVDGVVASVYAESAFEALFGKATLPAHWFVALSHLWSAPFRACYKLLPKETVNALYQSLKSTVSYEPGVGAAVWNLGAFSSMFLKGMMQPLIMGAK